MSAADRLDQIEARAKAATEGPWFVSEEDGSVWVDRGDGNTDGLTGELAPWVTGEADFIAHARTDVPWLIEQVRKREAALRAVLRVCDATEATPVPGIVITGAHVSTTNIRRAIEEALR